MWKLPKTDGRCCKFVGITWSGCSALSGCKMHCEQFAMKRSITTKTQLDMLSFPYRNRICIPYMRYIYIYIPPLVITSGSISHWCTASGSRPQVQSPLKVESGQADWEHWEIHDGCVSVWSPLRVPEMLHCFKERWWCPWTRGRISFIYLTHTN